MSRIDRFYAQKSLVDRGGGLLGIWPILPHISNHYGLYLRINGKTKASPRDRAFNKGLQEDKVGKQMMLRAWREAIAALPDASWSKRIAMAMVTVKRTNNVFFQATKGGMAKSA